MDSVAELAPAGVIWCTGGDEHDPPRQPSPRALRYPTGSVLLVGGVYGLGKSTLAARVFSDAVIVDPDATARRLGLSWDASHDAIFADLWRQVDDALAAPGRTVVCTLPGLRSWQYRGLRRRAKAAGAPFHIIYLDGSAQLSAAGQATRGRVIPAAFMADTLERWAWLRMRLEMACHDENGEVPYTFGAESVLVMDRDAVDTLRTVTLR